MTFVWSYTSLSKLSTCPYQFYRTTILKDIPKADTPALRAGREMHEAMEKRIGEGVPLASSFAHYEPYVQAVLSWEGETRVELKLGVTRSWGPAPFFGADVAGRCAVDVFNLNERTVRIVDWKTGGKVRRDDCRAQFDINAAMIFANYPDVQHVNGAWVYTGLREIVTGTGFEVTRDTLLPRVQARIEQQLTLVEGFEAAGEWPCRPSGLCKGWCPVRDCRFWRPNPKAEAAG